MTMMVTVRMAVTDLRLGRRHVVLANGGTHTRSDLQRVAQLRLSLLSQCTATVHRREPVTATDDVADPVGVKYSDGLLTMVQCNEIVGAVQSTVFEQ